MKRKTVVAMLAPANSIHTQRWVAALADHGCKVHLITQHPNENMENIYCLPFTGFLGYFLNVFSLRRLIRRLSPDLLHVCYASGYGTMARLSGLPYILSVWGSDVLLFPKISRFHHYLVKLNIEKAEHICSTSHAMAQSVREISNKIQDISITPFGVDTIKFYPYGNSVTNCDELIIGTVKSLEYTYGIDVLLRSVSCVIKALEQEQTEQACKIKILLVGDGSDRKILEKLSSELGIANRVTFVGKVAHEMVVEYYNKLDVYVAISRSESFGVSVLEASACGVPVVISNVGGLPEVVVKDVTGLIVPSESIEEAASAILKLVNSMSLRKRMGERGRKFVVERYSWSESIDIILAVYQKVLNSKINDLHK